MCLTLTLSPNFSAPDWHVATIPHQR